METIQGIRITNEVKKTKKRGISLIVLVITIIVILILAAAVILTINNNNPVAEANKARYESDRANIQAIFTNAVAKVMTHNRATVNIEAGQINDVISGVKETVGQVSYTVTNAMNKENEEGIIVFDKKNNTDTTFYTGKKLPIYAAGDTKWYVDEEGTISLEVAGVKYGEGVIAEEIIVTAQDVLDNAASYYGKKVESYQTGNDTIDTQVEWQVFSSDGNNVYLIATDYVPYNLLPKKTIKNDANEDVVYELTKGYSDYDACVDDDLLNLYAGSSDITDTRLQNLNKIYHDYLTTNSTVSGNDNMKVTACMLDIDFWKTFAGNSADYAIGGPTIEMLMSSYNKKYEAEGVDYKVEVTNIVGYQTIDNNGDIFRTSDTLYTTTNSDIANGMWLASPAYGPGANRMWAVTWEGTLDGLIHNNTMGFRPVVCLNSNAKLKLSGNNFKIMS